MKTRRWAYGLAFTAIAGAQAATADAAITINIVQSGSDVVATTTGTFDPTGLTSQYIAGVNGGLRSDIALFVSGTSGPGQQVLIYSGLTGPSSFGLAAITSQSSFSGDVFYLLGATGSVGVPIGSDASTVISATTTFANANFVSLGLAAGSYLYSSPHDTITVNVGSAVPEPATWAMMLLGFGGIGFALRRKRAPSLVGARREP